MPTMRSSRSWRVRSVSACSAMRRAKRWPTWPKPTSARSARIRRTRAAGVARVESLANPFQRRHEQLGIAAEPDAQEAVHLEVIAGNDEDALFVANPLDELGRSDTVRVADERDRAGFRRHVGQ